MNYSELKDYINSDRIDDKLSRIICSDNLTDEKKRYNDLLDEAYALYGDGDFHIISSPGRSEIGGNHTDHQHGHVLAASLNMDNIAIIKRTDDNTVRYKDGDFYITPVNLDDLSIHDNEINKSEALVRGIAFRLNNMGYGIGGFSAVCNSRVLVGSGISSSACFEIMIAEAFNYLYNEEKITPVERAIVGQYAENIYFGKPCGLMDQMAISVGGFVAIDFKEPDKPVIENYTFSFIENGYELILVNTKGDHSDLSHEYAAIPNEIRDVAKALGVDYLADSSKDKLISNLKEIRKEVENDRGILRAIHFYNEDERAIAEKEAVKNKDIKTLLKLMNESGHSSFEFLQNVYPASRTNSQSVAIGLALSELCLQGEGACRVHGGGFEGTIQAVVPSAKVEDYKKLMCSVFGDDCLLEVKIRPFGTITVI